MKTVRTVPAKRKQNRLLEDLIGGLGILVTYLLGGDGAAMIIIGLATYVLACAVTSTYRGRRRK